MDQEGFWGSGELEGEEGAGAHLAKSSVCLIGSKTDHAVYLHISVQYIKYSLVFFFFYYPKKYFFFLFSFF